MKKLCKTLDSRPLGTTAGVAADLCKSLRRERKQKVGVEAERLKVGILGPGGI